MSGNLNEGASRVSAADQHSTDDGKNTRFQEGNPKAHLPNDSKDQRTIANRIAKEVAKGDSSDDEQTKLAKKDPTLPAKSHGNEPSRGAKIDAELAADDERRLKEKDQA